MSKISGPEQCAGWGDPGYKDRWTMEVTNNSQQHSVILVVGRRIAQIVFWEVEPVEKGYEAEGKYQSGVDLNAIKESWKPENMLPKLYLDREVQRIARAVATKAAYDKFCETEPGISYAVPPAFPGLDSLPNNARASFAANRARRQFNNFGLTPNGRKYFRAEDFAASIYVPSPVS